MERKVSIERRKTSTLDLFAIGPSFETKAKTALYFSLSGEESLSIMPFAKPAQMLVQNQYRVISATLPAHENNKRPLHIKKLWEESPEALEQFFFDFENALSEIKDQIEGPIAVLGLSRGAFIGTHLAARIDEIDQVVGYAPLTYLEKAPHLDLVHLADKLKRKRILYTIGHKDTLVDTARVISTTSTFTDTLGAKQLQNATIQLNITPSIGREGHGTSDATFTRGVDWVVHGK